MFVVFRNNLIKNIVHNHFIRVNIYFQINLIENKRVISINKRGNTKLGFSMESHDCAISYNVLNIHKGALLTSHLIDQTKGRSLIVGDNYTFTGNLMDKTFSIKWIISTGKKRQ